MSLVSYLLTVFSVFFSPFQDGENVPYKIQPVEFPFLAHLTIFHKQADDTMSEAEKYCGGVIITKNAVLTSAFCIDRAVPSSKIFVRAGITNLKEENSTAQGSWIKSYVVHRKFLQDCEILDGNQFACLNDVAIVWLEKDFIFGPNVQPAVLISNTDSFVGQQGWIAGWGEYNETEQRVDELQKSQMRIISNENCQLFHKQIKIDSRAFCLISDMKNSISCRGDFGGPFIIDGKVYGISSFSFRRQRDGHVECDPTRPEMHLRLEWYRSWIDRTIEAGPNSKLATQAGSKYLFSLPQTDETSKDSTDGKKEEAKTV